jgi:hypothetical protein
MRRKRLLEKRKKRVLERLDNKKELFHIEQTSHEMKLLDLEKVPRNQGNSAEA